MNRVFFSLLFCGSLARADFDAKQWHSRMPLSVPAGSQVSEFIVGPEVFRHSTARLSDLRIMHDGAEVPYLVRRLAGQVREQEHSVSMRDKGWTKGKGVHAVLDLKGHAEHNRLRIVTAQHNFKEAVIIETSDDAQRWATVLPDGVIFDITRPEANVSDLTVTYPTSTRRYVRISIPGWTDPAFLEAAWLAEYKESDDTRDNIANLKPVITQNKADQTTDLVFDLGYTGQPCDRLVLRVGPGLFSRSVEVSTGEDGKNFLSRAGSVISRTGQDERLTVEWNETWERYIKLTVFNADSAPLDFGEATASDPRRVVRFPASGPGAYWLYLDNKSARAPIYDFARVQDPNVQAGNATVAAVEANPAFEARLAPYSERKPWVLNIMLGIALAVMAFITYRFARKATSPTV